MPKTHREEEEVAEKTLADDDDSSDEESDDESDEESESGSDDESGSGSDSDDDSGSDSDDESGSDSDTDDSSSKNKKKKDEDEDDEDDRNTIFKIQEISSKLSWLLDDLHRTFKPKSVPKIDAKNVFPYPYSSLPQHSPSSIKNVSNDMKSPISSPIRHGHGGKLCDRGAGGNYIYPSYAAPPTKSDIKKLYQNYTHHERQRISQNQQNERLKRDNDENIWKDSNFSNKFISGSNERRQQKKRKLFAKQKQKQNEMPYSFDELYKHYDQQKRLMEQRQNKMNRLKNKMYWFRKNNNDKNLKISEKKPLMKQTNVNNKKNEQNLKETETNLLNKAAQILLGNTNNDIKSLSNEYNVICPDSPDSLQQKILHITSDKEEEEEEEEEENRLPTFV